MRILHVLPTLDQSYGGPVRLVMDLSARSLPLGLESEVLGFGEANLPDNPFPRDRVHSLPEAFPRSYGYSPHLRAWLKTNLRRFDGLVLHGSWLYSGWASGEICRDFNLPYGAFPHGMLDLWTVNGQGRLKAVKKHAYWWWRERKTYWHARCVFFTTRREMELANRVFRFPPRQAVLSPYGIEPSPERVPRPQRAELEQPAGRRFALFLGRVHPKKNVDFLIRAWHAAAVPEPWHLLIAGPGEPGHLDVLQRLVARLGLAGHVHFLGFVAGDDKAYLLQQADWFLLPSKQENFGVAVLEAISHGCPVAISDQVYLAESFRDESEVLPLELDRWVEFFRTRMMDLDWRRHVLDEDREHLLQQFEIGRVTRTWCETLERELGGKSL